MRKSRSEDDGVCCDCAVPGELLPAGGVIATPYGEHSAEHTHEGELGVALYVRNYADITHLTANKRSLSPTTTLHMLLIQLIVFNVVK